MARLHARVGTIRQLEILLAVSRTGSITKASKLLHLTQPTVSVQLKKLADDVGVPLYEQLGRKLLFTEAGLELVKSAREIMESFDRLEMKLSDLQGLKAGTLRLAVVTTSKYLTPHFLGEFVKTYPAIDIVLKVANRRQIIEHLETGEYDFYVFSHPPENYELELVPFSANPLVPIAALSHPLAREKKIPFEVFAREPFLIREMGSGTRYAIDRHLSAKGLELNVRMTIESNEAIKHCVMSELGVSILSRHTLALGGSSGLKELDVEHLPIRSEWYLARLANKEMSVIASTFLDYVQAKGELFAELLAT
ncbi:LysR family transcriptional regulator [Marinobacterium sp. D7]|uniref:LysR family transcriptional regulator n=1 Tax=Marinobacterium ramblicola TaxID=2849041 RepID=UPI001C2CE5E5|nr:LysR family transcriptional regulator [Marinobacterium ramblicola]MBV1788425.1 LysR family transcriptional regulator [Marinobacterium ramblicola]